MHKMWNYAKYNSIRVTKTHKYMCARAELCEMSATNKTRTGYVEVSMDNLTPVFRETLYV